MSETNITAGDDGGVAISGDMTFYTVPDLWRDSEDMLQQGRDVVVDLRDVHRADSAGLALLIEWTRQARQNSVTINFKHVPESLMALARMTGLNNILPFH
jgi:phospholipid transport system transporter-binding protein